MKTRLIFATLLACTVAGCSVNPTGPSAHGERKLETSSPPADSSANRNGSVIGSGN